MYLFWAVATSTATGWDKFLAWYYNGIRNNILRTLAFVVSLAFVAGLIWLPRPLLNDATNGAFSANTNSFWIVATISVATSITLMTATYISARRKRIVMVPKLVYACWLRLVNEAGYKGRRKDAIRYLEANVDTLVDLAHNLKGMTHDGKRKAALVDYTSTRLYGAAKRYAENPITHA